MTNQEFQELVEINKKLGGKYDAIVEQVGRELQFIEITNEDEDNEASFLFSKNTILFYDFIVDKIKVTVSGGHKFTIKDVNGIIETDSYTFHVNEPYEALPVAETEFIASVNSAIEANTVNLQVNVIGREGQLKEEVISINISSAIFTYNCLFKVNVGWIIEEKPTTIKHLIDDYKYLRDDVISKKWEQDRDILAKFKIPINEIVLAYDKAYNNHKDAIALNKEVKAAKDALVANLFSIAGAGVLSWLSTAGHLAKALNKIKVNANVMEDLLQVTWDKYITSGSVEGAKKSLGLTTPLAYTTTLENEVNELQQDLADKFSSIFSFFKDKAHSLENIAQRGSAVDLTTEFKIYKQSVQFYFEAMKSLPVFTAKRITVPANAAVELEKGIWALWIKTNFNVEHKVNQAALGSLEVYTYSSEKLKGPHVDWPIANRFVALGLDAELNIDFGSWEYWTDELKILLTWANNFKMKKLF